VIDDQGTRLDFGDREDFAIELTGIEATASGPYAGMRVWINGQSIGNVNDPVFLATVVGMFEGLLENVTSFRSNELFQLPTAELWPELVANKDRHSLPSIEFLDAYDCFVIFDDNSLRFVWRSMSREQITDVTTEISSIPPVISTIRDYLNS